MRLQQTFRVVAHDVVEVDVEQLAALADHDVLLVPVANALDGDGESSFFF